MKRIVVFLAIIVVLLSMCIPALAAGFTPSVTNKPAPEIVPIIGGGGDGRPVFGLVYNESNQIIGYIYEDCIIVTPVSDVDSESQLSEEAKALLKELFNKITSGQMELPYGDVNPDYNNSNMVIRDLFDLSVLCGEHGDMMKTPGNTLTVTFDLGVAPGNDVVAMVYVGGKWTPVVSTVNNGDGTVTCVFDQVCPVAFSVRTDVSEPEQTGDISALPWMLTALAALVALVAVTVVYRKGMKQGA